MVIRSSCMAITNSLGTFWSLQSLSRKVNCNNLPPSLSLSHLCRLQISKPERALSAYTTYLPPSIPHRVLFGRQSVHNRVAPEMVRGLPISWLRSMTSCLDHRHQGIYAFIYSPINHQPPVVPNRISGAVLLPSSLTSPTVIQSLPRLILLPCLGVWLLLLIWCRLSTHHIVIRVIQCCCSPGRGLNWICCDNNLSLFRCPSNHVTLCGPVENIMHNLTRHKVLWQRRGAHTRRIEREGTKEDLTWLSISLPIPI